MRGEPFFDCQIGVVGCQALCLKGIMGIKDFEENMNRKDTVSIHFLNVATIALRKVQIHC